MLLQGLAFKGFTIEASDGKIGTVSDFLFDDSTWKLRWLVVDASTWLTGRKLLIHPSAIEKADVPASALLVKLTRNEVEKSPLIATDEPVSQQMEHRLYGYYGVDPVLSGPYYGGSAIAMPMAAPNVGRAAAIDTHLGSHQGDKRLRSLSEVTGYNIHASDGQIGHVESFLIDDETWEVRYLVADTRNWWFGRHVLLSPASVREIMWDQHAISLDLTCYKIKGSPVWEPTGLLDRTYEHMLQTYYGWPDRFLPAKHAPELPAPVAVLEHAGAAS